MKYKIAVAVLLIASLVLGGILVWQGKRFQDQKRDDTSVIIQFSNDWTQARMQLDEQKTVNQDLVKRIEQDKKDIEAITSTLNDEKAVRAKVETDAQKAAQQAQEEMAKRDAKIASLEKEVDEQTKQMVELNSAITNLEKKIADTEKELATTKGDKEFLLRELKRLQTEKAKLESQFNDLALLREQVRKLKDQLAVARRLEWIRMGVYGTQMTAKGGATKQMKGFATPASGTTATDLNVEIDTRGEVKTNAPPAAPK